jgi:hypothetical protein
MFIEPKDIEIDGKQFTISKFPAVAGREIVSKYGMSAIPKIGEYATNEAMMFKMLNYVAVKVGDKLQPLFTQALIDNHTGGFETLLKLEWALMEYNVSFFRDGRISGFLEDIAQKLPAWVSKTWTGFLQRSSQTEKPHSTN